MRVYRMGMVVFFLIFSLFIAGCGGGDSDAGSENNNQVLKLNISGEPTSIDPAKAFDGDSMEVVNNLFEGLTRLDENSRPQLAVAEKIDQSKDGLTYTITLREDAKWSNGEPVTAHDFEYAWKRVMNPDTASSASFLMFFIKNAEKYNAGDADADQVGVKAQGDRTLVVQLEQPTSFFQQLIAYTPFAPVYKKGVEAAENPFAEAAGIVSNGPFKITKWKHDAFIEAKKNKQYRKADEVKLAGIKWSMITDDTTAYQMFKQKELHLGEAPPQLQGQLIQRGEAKVTKGSGLGFYRFNVKEKPFTNKKIRQAFALAVDRQMIVKEVIQGKQEPAYAYVAPGTTSPIGDFRKSGKNYIRDRQYDRAKQLLKEGMEEEEWEKLPPITILFSKDEKNKKVAEAIQEMWRKHLGAKVKLQAKETKVYFADQKSGNYMVSWSSFLPDYNDPYNYLESFQTGHSMNRTGWSDPEYDKLLKQARLETDENKRIKLLHQAEERLLEEMPLFPLYYYNNIILQHPEVKNVIRHIVGPNDYRFVQIQQ